MKRVWGGDGEGAAREHRRRLQRQTAGRLEVRTSLGRARNSHAEVSFTVEVPFDTPVFVRTISGDMTVSKVRGDLQVESTAGTVEATGTPRVLRLKTVSGDVKILDAAAPDVLSASDRERQRRGQGPQGSRTGSGVGERRRGADQHGLRPRAAQDGERRRAVRRPA